MLRRTATPVNERQDQLRENRSRFRETCVRCSLLRPDPSQRARLAEIRDNLIARIAEAETEAWLGEVEGLQVTQLDWVMSGGVGHRSSAPVATDPHGPALGVHTVTGRGAVVRPNDDGWGR